MMQKLVVTQGVPFLTKAGIKEKVNLLLWKCTGNVQRVNVDAFYNS